MKIDYALIQPSWPGGVHAASLKSHHHHHHYHHNHHHNHHHHHNYNHHHNHHHHHNHPRQEMQMQPAYRVGRMASATQPRRREQVIFKMTVMMMKVMVMKVMVMKVMVMIGDEYWDDDGDALWASVTHPQRRE